MTTAAAGTVREIELLRRQARATHKVLWLNVDGISHEESLIRPQPDGNCLNWVVGHLLSAYDGTLPILGQEPVFGKNALERYGRGSAPIRDSADALEFRELMTAWDEASDRIDAGLAGLTAEILGQPAPMSPTNDPDETIRSLLAFVSFHQAYHVGQAGLLRRIVGKEGAIA